MFNWLLVLIAYLPFQIAFNPWPGIDLASIRVFIICLFLIWLIKTRTVLAKQGQPLFLILFLILACFSLIGAANPLWGLRKLVFFLSIFPLYFLVSHLSQTKRQVKRITQVLVGSSFLVALVALGQFFSQFIFGLEKVYQFWAVNIVPIFCGFNFGSLVLANPSWLVDVAGQTFLRATAFFPDPHMLSFYCGLILPLAVVLFGRFVPKFFLLPASCLLFITCLLTFSRGGYLGLIISFLVLAGLIWRYLKSKKIAILILLSLLVFLIPISPIATRFYSIFDLGEGSNVGRIEIWQQALEMSQKHPWLGVGLGNYSLQIMADIDYRNPMTAHNLYLDILSEMGILALIVWLVLIFGTLWQLARGLSPLGGDSPRAALSIGLIGSLVYFSVHSFFETPIYNPVILAILMVILGLSYVK